MSTQKALCIPQRALKNPNYEIRWFRYNEGSKNNDYYAGIGWDILSLYHNSLLIENVELSSEKPYEEFKVIGIIKEIVLR